MLQSGREINADECIWCTQAGAAKWLKESTDLALDDDGFIAVNATLESTSHQHVFAAGRGQRAQASETEGWGFRRATRASFR